jgi:hypothetical protein
LGQLNAANVPLPDEDNLLELDDLVDEDMPEWIANLYGDMDMDEELPLRGKDR